MGIVLVAFFVAFTAAFAPATMTSALRRTSSAARSGRRSTLLSANR